MKKIILALALLSSLNIAVAGGIGDALLHGLIAGGKFLEQQANPDPIQLQGKYKFNINREDQDIYSISGASAFLKTRYCYEYRYYEDAVYNADRQEVYFNGGAKCDVVGVFNK